jgi:hypothetical protein
MSIVKEKSPKPSTRLHAGMRITPKVNHKRVQPRSMEQLAEEFCGEMIQNLRRNVAENKGRFLHLRQS